MAVSGPASSSESSWRDSNKGMSNGNIKGLILALSSSFFIGASFIVKKKGLKIAGSSGVRAGNPLFIISSFLTLYLVSCVIKTGGFMEYQFILDPCRFALLILNFSLPGAGGYSYLYEPLWWVGMITSTFLQFSWLLLCFNVLQGFG